MEKIDFEFRLIGDRRGGQHAIIYWLMFQFNGFLFWKNDASGKHDILRLSKFPNLHRFRLFLREGDKRFIATMVNYEDKTLEVVDSYNYSQYSNYRYDMIVLRDPYNLFASKIYHWRKNKPWKLKYYLKNLETWKQKAKEVLNKKCLFINFNKWFVNEEYRREILLWFPEKVFIFTDFYKKYVPMIYGQSSFDGRKFYGKANQMDILGRYKRVRDDPLMKKLVADKEIKELSGQIFGKVI